MNIPMYIGISVYQSLSVMQWCSKLVSVQ